MQMRKIAIAAIMLAIALALLVNFAHATATLSIEDASGNQKTQFDLGNKVYIRWSASTDAVITITYYESAADPVGDLLETWPKSAGAGLEEYLPPSTGFYDVALTGASPRTFAYGTFFVIPESILGTLMATVAGFAAFGTVGVVKYRRAKSVCAHS